MSNANDDIEVPVTNAYENLWSNTLATAACNVLNWIETSAPRLLPNSEETYFRCPCCRQQKYVYQQFSILRNFPICIDCASRSLNEHR